MKLNDCIGNKNFKWFLYLFANGVGIAEDGIFYDPDFVSYDGEDVPDEGPFFVKCLYSDTQSWAGEMGLLGDIFLLLLHDETNNIYYGVRMTFDSWGGEMSIERFEEVFEYIPNVYAPKDVSSVGPVLIGF